MGKFTLRNMLNESVNSVNHMSQSELRTSCANFHILVARRGFGIRDVFADVFGFESTCSDSSDSCLHKNGRFTNKN